jgi:hypothetical protein
MSARRSPFWLRKTPHKNFDIARLLPPHLPRGCRFETPEDAINESNRSEELLVQGGDHLNAEYLNDCRSGAYRCLKPSCPICAREFRRWFVGQTVRHAETAVHPQVLTVLLETAPRGSLDTLNLVRHRALLRKRLKKAFGDATAVIGGFEVVYKANARKWILHVNLLVIGAQEGQLAKFRKQWPAQRRAVVVQPLRDVPRQLSYVLKFTTYHRPGKQTGPRRGRAKPLNASEHCELVRWMTRFRFEELVFLLNCRRNGRRIVHL